MISVRPNSILIWVLTALLIALGAVPASACGTIVRVTFVEASPDLFMIEHLKGQPGDLASVTIDMSPSIGNAYVDTPYGPAKSNAGKAIVLDSISGFSEGAQSGTLTFRAFTSGHRFTFLVDLDDRAAGGDNNMNVLTANELEGGKVSVRIKEAGGPPLEWTGTFDAEGIALVGNRACAHNAHPPKTDEAIAS